MIVRCAWCKKIGRSKPPLDSLAVTDGICKPCAKKEFGIDLPPEAAKDFDNPPRLVAGRDVAPYMLRKGWGLTVGTLANPRVFSRLKNGYLHIIQLEATGWRLLEANRGMGQREMISIGVFPLLTDATLRASRRLRKNPGEAWHKKQADEAGVMDKRAAKKKRQDLSDFYHGKEVAHRESEFMARSLQQNPIAAFSLGNPGRKKRVRQNPPNTVNAKIAGIIYARCIEVRAEKTAFKPGLYRHPFSRKSQVQVLALDNGDLLLHSATGAKLWKEA